MSPIVIVLIVVGSLLVLFILFLLLAAFFASKELLSRSGGALPTEFQDKIFTKIMGENKNEFEEISKEGAEHPKFPSEPNVEVRTEDGLTLRGFFILANEKSNKTILCLHGYKSNGKKEFGSRLNFLLEGGYNVLIVNHRGHGPSDGNHIGFGVLDHKDALKWLEKINELVPGGKIAIYGISMGSATTMQTTALALPDNVVCAISDCGYTSVWDEIKYLLKFLFKIPSFPILNFIDFFAKKTAKYGFRTETPLKAVKASKIPTLFIHGSNDLFVPTQMVYQCFEACAAEKKLLVIEGAAHAQAHFQDNKLYEKEFNDFANKYLN